MMSIADNSQQRTQFTRFLLYRRRDAIMFGKTSGFWCRCQIKYSIFLYTSQSKNQLSFFLQMVKVNYLFYIVTIEHKVYIIRYLLYITFIFFIMSVVVCRQAGVSMSIKFLHQMYIIDCHSSRKLTQTQFNCTFKCCI